MSYNPVTKIWSGPSRPSIYNTDVSLGYLILNLLKTTPDRVIQINADNGVETTCGEMFAKSVKIIRFLTSLGLKQNDVVGIVATNSENLTPLVYACLTLGLPINPLSPLMKEADITYMYSQTRPRVIFSDVDLLEEVKLSFDKMRHEGCKIITLIEHVEGYQFLDEIIESADKEVDDFEIPSINISSTPAFILCSSGTTGMVKGISKSHKEFIETIVPVYQQSLDKSDVIFFTMPLYWISGIGSLLFSALCGPTRVISSKPFTGDSYMDIIDKYNVTFIMFFPFLYNMIMQSKNSRPMKSVRSIFFSGGHILEDLIERSKKLFPNATIITSYGSTEGNFITHSKTPRGWSSGKPANNYQIKIVDENGINQGPNEQGEIFCKSTLNFPGYFNDPEKTAETFKDGWLITGDLGYFDDEGYIFVTERIKDLLKYGVSFTSNEIEIIIDEIEGVKSSAVVGVKDELWDIVYAFVIKDPFKSNLTEEFIEKFVESRVIDEKKIRGGVHFVDEFPLTSSGKVKKNELRKIAKEIHESKKLKK